jgi:hypothetical protein
MTLNPDHTLHIGDVISLKDVRANGTIGPGGVQKKWRVVLRQGDDVRLQPLHDDGTVDEFNDATGEFWIRCEGKKGT